MSFIVRPVLEYYIHLFHTEMQMQYKREIKYIHNTSVQYITRIQYFQSTHNTCSIFCWHTPLNLK